MPNESLGFIETKGFIGAIEAADAMVKAARVRLLKTHKVGSARVCVIVEGDVAACQAAVDAGTTASRRVGEFLLSNVIPRPDTGTDALVGSFLDEMKGRKAARKGRGKRTETTSENMADEEKKAKVEAKIVSSKAEPPKAKKVTSKKDGNPKSKKK